MSSSLPASGPGAGPGLIWLIAGCMMIQPLATDLYLPSLPHIAAYFGVSPAMVQQTLSLFLLGFACVQLISGPLSDHFGRRPVLLGGLAIYVLASVLCTWSPTLELLVLGRFLQAIGCCTSVVVARAIVHDAYPHGEGVHVMARVSSFYALAPLLGPLAGAWLQVTFGWRAAFLVFSLVGLMLAGVSMLRLAETNAHRGRQRFDPAKFLGDYLRLAKSPVFWAFTLPGGLSLASIFVFLSGSSFLLINVFEVPTRYAGFFFSGGAAGYLCGTLVCRRLLRRLGVRRTMQLGGRVAFAACLAFPACAALGLAHWATLLLGQCLVMFAHGINFPCAQSGAVTPFPDKAGAAAALMGSFAMILAFGVGLLVGFTYDGSATPISLILLAMAVLLLSCNGPLDRLRAPPP